MARRPRKPSLIGAALRLVAVVALGAASTDKRIADADHQASRLITERRSTSLDRAMPAITDLGSVYAVGAASGVLWLLGRRRLARDVAGAGMLAWGVAQAAKRGYNRVRPYDNGGADLLVRRPAGTSYPSGHPAVAAAVQRVLDPDVREPVRGLLRRAPRVVAFSRVYVGAHYPTDVIGGLLLGRAVGDLWRRFSTRS